MKRITWFLASMLLLPVAVAQDEVVEEAPEIRRYTVEIVVFAYVEDISVGTEVFPPEMVVVVEEELPVEGDDGVLDEDEPELLIQDEPIVEDELIEDDGIVADDEAEEIDPDAARLLTVLMTEDEFTLQHVIDKFDELDAYETIMHIGWTQATLAREETEAIELQLFGEPPPGLTGSFSLYLGRYLHLIVDLALDAPGNDDEEPTIADTPAFRFGDFRLRYEDEEPLFEELVRYRLVDNRIIKNGDIRYFDHPKFGVVAKVTRAEEEEEDPDAEDGEDIRPGSRQLLGRVQ